MSIHSDDADLIKAILDGDDLVNQQLIVRLAYIARREGVPIGDCEDIAQNVLLAVLQQLRKGYFRGDSRLETWIFSILRGKLADYWRVSKLLPISVNYLEMADADIAATTGDYMEVRASVRKALSAMPTELRAVLLLKRAAGYSLREIAQSLGMTIGQVSSRLYSAEKMFRRLVLGELSDSPH